MKATIDVPKLQKLIVKNLLGRKKTGLSTKEPLAALSKGKASRAVVEKLAELLGCEPRKFSDLKEKPQKPKGRTKVALVQIDVAILQSFMSKAGFTMYNRPPGVSTSTLLRIIRSGQSSRYSATMLAQSLRCKVTDFTVSSSSSKSGKTSHRKSD